MLENIWAEWTRGWIQSNLNSQQAACHNHVTSKSPSSFYSYHSQMHHFSDQVWLHHGHIWTTLLVLLLPSQTTSLCWCLCSVLDSQPMWLWVTFPWKCHRRPQPWPFSLIPSMTQHTCQAHLACLPSCNTSTWTLLRPWTASPAGERHHVSDVVQMCTHTYACPWPKSSLPASLPSENISWAAKRDCRESS